MAKAKGTLASLVFENGPPANKKRLLSSYPRFFAGKSATLTPK